MTYFLFFKKQLKTAHKLHICIALKPNTLFIIGKFVSNLFIPLLGSSISCRLNSATFSKKSKHLLLVIVF